VAGHYAYVAIPDDGLAMIDVRDLANCVRVGGYGTRSQVRGVAVSGNYASMADGQAGLQVIDVRNPTNGLRVGGYETKR
jgi:hypothetical protein